MPFAYDLLITNGLLLPAPGVLPPLHDGFVAMRGNTIAAVGGMAELPAQARARQTIDADGDLVMPGLVNGHCHAAMTLFRGLADDLPLMEWLQGHIFPAEARFVSPEMAYWCSKLAAAEMILSGTTTVADSYFFEEAAARAFHEAGLRAIVAQGIIDFPAPGVPDPGKNIAAATSFLDSCPGRQTGRITPAVFCHSPYTCSAKTLVQAKALAREQGRAFFIHLAETEAELKQIHEQQGMSPVEYLDRLHVLDRDTVAIHCVHLTTTDMSILQHRETGVITCPESNMKLASGTCPVPKMLAAGIRMGLGTDGCASNNDLDLFGEMDSLAKLHKVVNLDPTIMPASQVLHLATSGGAAALGMGDTVGRLAPGLRADCIIIDLDQPHLTPFHNHDLLVYASKGRDVRTTIIDGVVVMDNRQILTFDLAETMSHVRNLAAALR